MRSKKITFFTGLFLVSTLSGNTIYGEVRTYHEKAGGKEYVNRYQIERKTSGFFISVVSRCNQQVVIKKKIWLDRAYSTVKWQYQNIREETDIFAFREGNTICLSGMNRGKWVEKVYEIDSLPWKQQFPLDFEKFAQSEEEVIQFWAIGTDGPADMKIAKFTATKKENGTVLVNGNCADMIRVYVSFAGLLSVFWHGNSWHRVRDGRFIRFRSTGAPGHPPTIMEMISESY